MTTRVLVTTAAILGIPALLAAITPEQVRTHTLANGMKVIIEEDHDIPNVAMYFFYKVGSRNERPGITGISHFFEHMMFNGAKKYGPKQFDIEMEQAGGRNNAYTSRDVTVYTDWFPRTALRLMFDMESDRIRNLSFDPKMIESERGVVASERLTRTDNSNFGSLYEQLNAAAYTAHPYGWPVVGWPSDIQAWTMDDLKAHFRMGYAPNNCVLVIVGDVVTDEVLQLAKEFMEPIPKQEPPPPIRTVEPRQIGERRVTVQRRAELPIQMMSYHIPNAAHPDLRVLNVISAILSEGRSSRFYARLVDNEQIALSVTAQTDELLDPGQFIIFARPRAGVDTATVDKAIFEELEKLRTTQVPEDELRKAKNQLLTAFYREMKTIAGRANQIGSAEVFLGDYRKLYETPARYEAVTSAEILRVAKQYFDPKNRTIATLVPEATPKPEVTK